MPPRKGLQAIMNPTRSLKGVPRPIRPDTTVHLFKVGQSVRLKEGFGDLSRPPTGTYRITGTLPARGGSPQYRIRNDSETHERVATQDSLELVISSSSR